MFFNLQESDIAYIAIFYSMLSVFIYFKLRSPVLSSIDQMGQIRRIMSLMIWLSLFSGLVVVSGGFLAHQDTAWHQVNVAADELIPGRLIIYSVFYPLYIIVGGAIWLYAKTRLSSTDFDAKFKISLLCMILSPFMFLPSQDPNLMVFSADLWNIIFRASYWAMMAIWVTSLLYLVARLGMMIASLFKPA